VNIAARGRLQCPLKVRLRPLADERNTKENVLYLKLFVRSKFHSCLTALPGIRCKCAAAIAAAIAAGEDAPLRPAAKNLPNGHITITQNTTAVRFSNILRVRAN
jgi:hypothetical protein